MERKLLLVRTQVVTIFTDRKAKVMLSQACVILSTGGVYPSIHLGMGVVDGGVCVQGMGRRVLGHGNG